MFKTTLTSLAALALMAPAAFAATETVINFEEYSAGDAVTSVMVGDAIGTVDLRDWTGTKWEIRNEATTGLAVALDSNDAFDPQNPADGDPDLQAPFYAEFDANGNPVQGTETLSPGNVLVIEEDPDFDAAADNYPDDSAKGGVIRFTFDKAVNFAGFQVFDDVTNFKVQGWVYDPTKNNGAGGYNKVAQTNNINLDHDNQFATFDLAGDLSLSKSGLSDWSALDRVSFNFNNSSGAIDNLRFILPAVPVPATLPLLLAGVGGLAYMGRRRRKA